MSARKLTKPVIVCSRCLEFSACRWDGLMIENDFIRQLMPHVVFKAICPESEIGLGVPRDPIRVIREGERYRLYQPATGKDLTASMNKFTEKYLKSLSEVDGFILKSRSPSCGIKDVKIYSGIDKATANGKGTGLFGQAVMAKFSDLPIEDEKRLSNLRIREHFLIRIFALARWRNLKKSMVELTEFHASNKLLLMAHSQKEFRIMGRIMANRDRRNLDQVFAEYGIHFKRALATNPRAGSNINGLLHRGVLIKVVD